MHYPRVLVVAGLALAVQAAPASAGLTTNASGQWQYVTLGAQYGQYAGYSALVVHFAPQHISSSLARNIAIFDNQSLGGARIQDVLVNGQSSGWYGSIDQGCRANPYGGADVCLPGGQAVVMTGSSYATSFVVVFDRNLANPHGLNPVAISWDGSTDPEAMAGGGFQVSRVGPPVVTPEPLSMTLLATGLAGVGGASWRRRRKQQQASEG